MQVGAILVPSSAVQYNSVFRFQQRWICRSSALIYLMWQETVSGICFKSFHAFQRVTFLYTSKKFQEPLATRVVYCWQNRCQINSVSKLAKVLNFKQTTNLHKPNYAFCFNRSSELRKSTSSEEELYNQGHHAKYKQNSVEKINFRKATTSSEAPTTVTSGFNEVVENSAEPQQIQNSWIALKTSKVCAHCCVVLKPAILRFSLKNLYSSKREATNSHPCSQVNCGTMAQPTTCGCFPQVPGEGLLRVTNGSHPIVDIAFERVVDALTTIDDPRLEEFSDWLRRIVEYNVPEGKRNRLVAVMLTHQLLEKDNVTENTLEKAAILGWCVELLQAYFLICDDIMDNSLTRRGKKCWYLVEGVQMMAINDALLLKTAIYKILRTFFRDHPNYLDLMELFQEVSYQTSQGQCLDMLSERHGCEYTEERYNAIVIYKTAYYSFSLPIRLGMYLAGIIDKNVHKKAESLALRIGHIFQIQDDFLDCYGEPDITGKVGTDIIDSKCSWMIVKALQIATSDQKKQLLENYGKGEPGGPEEAAVKEIYKDLDMITVFRQNEEQAFFEIKDEIAKLESTADNAILNSDIFKLLANKIYRRNK